MCGTHWSTFKELDQSEEESSCLSGPAVIVSVSGGGSSTVFGTIQDGSSRLTV